MSSLHPPSSGAPPSSHSKFENASSKWFTRRLFLETCLPETRLEALFTLKPLDQEIGGKTYPSFHRLYLLEADVTEYLVATKYLGGWEHWLALQECEWFKPYLARWRTELELKLQAEALALYSYLRDIRSHVAAHAGQTSTKDDIYNISGFDSYRQYLECGTVEILTFYGDIYDEENDTFQKNRVIKVVDRHKVLSNKPNPSYFGSAPIFHSGWRVRPDNLWAMGPLDNLVGMQYRIDHLENMKADVFDLIAYPPIKIKGYVEDFEWGPFSRIYVSEEGDVELMSPPVQALAADNQIALLEAKMEEMAGSPKEAMGFRTPGEKTAYEVQRLENAASRIFQNKIAQFERETLENLLNAMLELARRNLNPSTIRVFDSEYKIGVFKSLTADDITGNGRIRPVAARHFAEKAQIVQNLNQFYASPAFQSVAPHFSSIAAARLWEHLLELEDYDIVEPYISITEQAKPSPKANMRVIFSSLAWSPNLTRPAQKSNPA